MWPFNQGITIQVTILAAFLMASGAAANWLRDDARNDCNAAWEIKLGKANEAVLLELAARQKKLDDLQRILAATEGEAARLDSENRKLLEVQRASVPLSNACLACRIPNERLWLRRPNPTTPAKGS